MVGERIISADTIVQSPANPQTLNRYSYCLNNPLKYIDPTGHFPAFVIPWIIEKILENPFFWLGVMATITYYFEQARDAISDLVAEYCDAVADAMSSTGETIEDLADMGFVVYYLDDGTQIIQQVGLLKAEASEPEVKQGKSRAPTQGEPDSVYEQVNEQGEVVSRTTYDSNGNRLTREDFPGSGHKKNIDGKYYDHHVHEFLYNDKGQPIGENWIGLD